MKDISIIDSILSLLLILLCPVVAISVIQWDFSFPIWGYIVFVIAASRIYQLFSKNKNTSNAKVKRRRYEAGDEIETNIVGVTFENRQQIIQKIAVGHEIYLTREPENPHDKNAIKVLVDRYTEYERKELKPELQNKYGTFSFNVSFVQMQADMQKAAKK